MTGATPSEIFLPQADTLLLQATYRGVRIAGSEVTVGFLSKKLSVVSMAQAIPARSSFEPAVDAAVQAGLKKYADALAPAQAVCGTLAPQEQFAEVGTTPYWDAGFVVLVVPCRDGRLVGLDAVSLVVRFVRDVAAKADWQTVNTNVRGICKGS